MTSLAEPHANPQTGHDGRRQVAPAHEVPADRCPGLVRPYASNDGLLVRLRTAGRPLSLDTLGEIVALADEFGDGTVQITSRGALQLRGIADPLPATVSERIEATGIIPTPSHELVRNIITSPLTGLDAAGRADVRPMVRAYDEALRADAALAALPGRFLVVFDDGRGDVLGEHFDLAYQALGSDRGAVYAGGVDHGWAVPAEDAVPAMLALAHAYLAARDGLDPMPWHVRELPTPLGAPWEGLHCAERTVVTQRPPLGAVASAVSDVAVVGIPLGLLTAPQFATIERVARRVGAREVVTTPWRSLVVPGGAAHLPELSAAGLVTSEDSAWSRVAACTGAPGCARAELDTQDFALRLVEAIGGAGPQVYLSACDRRCGAPAGEYVDLLRPASLDDALAMPGVRR